MTNKVTRSLRAAGRLLLAAALAVAAQAAVAQQVIVIGNDRGGLVGQRAGIVDRIRAAGDRVEIRGNVCYSACTMYLGAGNVCIDPRTRFGFHGPTRNGQSLDPAEFEHWTGVMARYYNASLRAWYMSSARYQTFSVAEISGADLIRMGYPSC